MHDNVSRVIAFLALIASVSALYFQFFHVKRDLRVHVFEQRAHQSDGVIDMQVLFVNDGSKEQAIAGGRFAFSNCGTMDPKTTVGDHMEPIVLKPGQKAFRRIRVDTSRAAIVFVTNHPCAEPPVNGNAFVTPEFRVVSDNGDVLELSTPPWPAECEGFPSVCHVLMMNWTSLDLLQQRRSNKRM